MDNVKNDLYYIQKIKQDIIFINTQMNGVDAEELICNDLLSSVNCKKSPQTCI